MNPLKITFTTIVVLIPILSMYGPYVHSSMSLLDCILLAMFPVLLFSIHTLSKRDFVYLLIPFFVLILINSLFREASPFIEAGSTIRTLRYLFYLTFIILFSKNFLDINYAIKLLIWISLFSTLFLFVQLIGIYVLGIYIKGYIPFLEVMRDSLSGFGDSGFVDRPRSIFVEPASYAGYVSIGLIVTLFSSINRKNTISYILIVGIIASASNSGVALLLYIAIAYIYLNRNIIRIKWQYFLLPFIILATYTIFKSRLDLTMLRIDEGKSFDGRFNGYEMIDYVLNNDITLFFGCGFIKVPEDIYLAGWMRLFYYSGLAGILSFVYLLIMSFFSCNKLGKVLVGFLIVSSIGNAGILGSSIILSMSLILNCNTVFKSK